MWDVVESLLQPFHALLQPKLRFEPGHQVLNFPLKTQDGVKGTRVAFSREVCDPAETREVLIEMVRQARQG